MNEINWTAWSLAQRAGAAAADPGLDDILARHAESLRVRRLEAKERMRAPRLRVLRGAK